MEFQTELSVRLENKSKISLCNYCNTDIINKSSYKKVFCSSVCRKAFYKKYPVQLFLGRTNKELTRREQLCELARYGDVNAQKELYLKHMITALYNPKTKKMVRFKKKCLIAE